MKKTIFSILGTFMFAALFMMNLSFFNEKPDNGNIVNNSIITTTPAKANVHYEDAVNRFFRGCKPLTGGVCVLSTPDPV